MNDERAAIARAAAAELERAMEDLAAAGVLRRPRPLTDATRDDLEHARGELRDMLAAIEASLGWVSTRSLGTTLKVMPPTEAQRLTDQLRACGLLD